MIEKITDLAKQFIEIKSIEGNSEELEKILELSLDPLCEYTIERFEKNGVKSALVYNVDSRPRQFDILFNAHLDVIPGKESQYKALVENGRLHGVGSMDMKANAAAMIYAFRENAKKVDYPIALQIVTDEEVGGFNGTRYQVEEGVDAKFVLAGEPTNFDIVHEAKGVLWAEINFKGKAAHGAYPWRGENAIEKAIQFISDLEKCYPNPSEQKWVTTYNISDIKTENSIYNKIPDKCTLCVDIRFIPEDQDTVRETIESLLDKNSDVIFHANEPALDTNKENPHLLGVKNIASRVLQKNIVLRGAQGSSDARHFKHVGSPGIEFGPIGNDIGGDDEWVDLKSLEQFYVIISELICSHKSK